MNTALLPRPHRCDRPRVEGYEPLIKCRIERVSRSKKNAWRATILVDNNPMAFSHHDTKGAAESRAEGMIDAYAKAHYFQV